MMALDGQPYSGDDSSMIVSPTDIRRKEKKNHQQFSPLQKVILPSL